MKVLQTWLFPETLRKGPFFVRCSISFVLLYGIQESTHSENFVENLVLAICVSFYMAFFILFPRHRLTNLSNTYKFGALIVPALYAILLLVERDKEEGQDESLSCDRDESK